MHNIALHAHPKRQDGAVLIVGLLILIVLTSMAVTGASSSTVSEKIAANAQVRTNSFQVAESASVIAINTPAWVNEAMKHTGDPTYTNWATETSIALPPGETTGISATSTISARQEHASGYSLHIGSGLNYIRLQIDSDATVYNTQRSLTHGYVRLGAGG